MVPNTTVEIPLTQISAWRRKSLDLAGGKEGKIKEPELPEF